MNDITLEPLQFIEFWGTRTLDLSVGKWVCLKTHDGRTVNDTVRHSCLRTCAIW